MKHESDIRRVLKALVYLDEEEDDGSYFATFRKGKIAALKWVLDDFREEEDIKEDKEEEMEAQLA